MSQDLHQETITLFNHHPKTDKWYSAVLTGVHLELSRGAAPSVNAGIVKGDDILAILPVSTGKTITDPDGETVVEVASPETIAGAKVILGGDLQFLQAVLRFL